MRRNRILYALGISAFIIILGYALLRELDRNQAQISNSISGVITATPAAGAGIVKTDNAYLLLFEPGSSYPIATKVIENHKLMPRTPCVFQATILWHPCYRPWWHRKILA